jgi:DNA-directed RNA polymerase specialized sigma24 family protein
MSTSLSIRSWIRRLEGGDRVAVERLWKHYFERLVAVARHKLLGVPRQMADEEDVVLSALKSFCRAARQRRFPRLADSGDLWQILVMLTRNKAAKLRDYHRRDKRDARRVQQMSPPAADADALFLDLIESSEPDPQFAALVAEQCQFLLELLPDEQLRQMALRKMEGYTNDEIATQFCCAPATVERRLARIRKCWLRAIEEERSPS